MNKIERKEADASWPPRACFIFCFDKRVRLCVCAPVCVRAILFALVFTTHTRRIRLGLTKCAERERACFMRFECKHSSGPTALRIRPNDLVVCVAYTHTRAHALTPIYMAIETRMATVRRLSNQHQCVGHVRFAVL